MKRVMWGFREIFSLESQKQLVCAVVLRRSWLRPDAAIGGVPQTSLPCAASAGRSLCQGVDPARTSPANADYCPGLTGCPDPQARSCRSDAQVVTGVITQGHQRSTHVAANAKMPRTQRSRSLICGTSSASVDRFDVKHDRPRSHHAIPHRGSARGVFEKLPRRMQPEKVGIPAFSAGSRSVYRQRKACQSDQVQGECSRHAWT